MRSLIHTLLFFGMVFMGSQVSAKRAAPAKIAPISVEGLLVSPLFEGQTASFSVFLTAKSLATNDIKWKTRLFGRSYDTHLERDVQEIHMRSLALEGTTLVAKDEKGQAYKVDAKSGALLEPAAAIDYPARK